MSRRRIPIRDERGQTMVEFALVVPILCVVLFGILQFGAIYNDYVTLTDATRVGARKAAVSRREVDPAGTAATAARNSAEGLDPAKVNFTVAATAWERGESVTVTGTFPYKVNLLGFVVASGNLTSKTTERVE
jgi:Flp pilus assembly protein TadG